MTVERIPEILARLVRLEKDMDELSRLWKSSVDDIKAIIRAEISDLKSEQIGDLKDAVRRRDQHMAEFENRIREAEDSIRSWDAGRGVVSWVIKTLIAGGSLAAGYIGGKHLT